MLLALKINRKTSKSTSMKSSIAYFVFLYSSLIYKFEETAKFTVLYYLAAGLFGGKLLSWQWKH